MICNGQGYSRARGMLGLGLVGRVACYDIQWTGVF